MNPPLHRIASSLFNSGIGFYYFNIDKLQEALTSIQNSGFKRFGWLSSVFFLFNKESLVHKRHSYNMGITATVAGRSNLRF